MATVGKKVWLHLPNLWFIRIILIAITKIHERLLFHVVLKISTKNFSTHPI